MHRLDYEARRETGLQSASVSLREHVGRDVAAIDVEAIGEKRNEDPPRTATRIEHGLPEPSDRRAEVGQLFRLRFGDELAPPPRDQAVMPRPRLGSHRRKILSIETTPTRPQP